MSSYPPPPPGGPYPPYDPRAQRQALRLQAQAMKAQARAQRYQYKMQQRSLRRRSILGPLIILAIGVAFLLTQLGSISWGQALEWYSRWWPGVLILAGFVLLCEWGADQRSASAQGSAGRVRSIGGGVVFLLILLALTGLSAHGVEYGMAWHDHAFGDNYARLNHLFGDRHDAENTLTSAIAPGATLVVHNPHGDVTISGESTDGDVHVSVHTETYAWKDADADAKAHHLQPVFNSQGKDLTLDVASVEGGQADLTIELPRTAGVTLQSGNGAVNITDMSAPIVISANHGDIEMSGINASVSLHIHDDDANITLHSITGPVLIDGHGGDTEISDVHGDVTLQGDFFGSTHLQRVNGNVRFESSRTRFSAARLDDEFSITNSSLDANQLVGPVVLKTVDKNITLDRVEGSLDIVNRNGSISVTHAPPPAAISIQNTHGSIDLGLPATAGFSLTAQTRNGDMENDFGLANQGSDEEHSLHGNIAGGGPPVNLMTSDGDVTIRRSSIAPLPPVPPAPPITFAPPPPPKTSAPPAPKAPKPPPPPVGRTF